MGNCLGGFISFVVVLAVNRPALNRYGCCLEKSQKLTAMDPSSSASVASVMRLRFEAGDSLGVNEGLERIDTTPWDGVWWMDGNPAPEVILSFADSHYKSDEDKANNIFHLPTLALEGGTWAYEDSWFGRTLFIIQCSSRIEPLFVTDDTKTKLIIQEVDPMDYIDDDTYFKRFPGGAYIARRIIDANGAEAVHWPIFAGNYTGKSLLTYRHNGEENSCLLTP